MTCHPIVIPAGAVDHENNFPNHQCNFPNYFEALISTIIVVADVFRVARFWQGFQYYG
jgi:hypothetical protein